MSSYVQENVQFKLIDLRAFSTSQGLAFEMSSLDDIKKLAATYRRYYKKNMKKIMLRIFYTFIWKQENPER